MTTIGDVGAGHVLGRYELLIPVATGGMAVVWAARMKGTRGFQKIVAIKTIRAEMSDDPLFEQMFLDEASLASRVRHPHVVEILDLGEEQSVLYLVMEWIDGEPLHVIMKQAAECGGVPLPVAVRIASQLCGGLHAAHEVKDDHGTLYGLVHRDVSPQNVMVTYDGVAKLVDFGVAKAQGRNGETQAGQIKGKAGYMAPEQAQGGAVDRRTDIFAAGIVLYVMTTGKHPFRRENDMATMLNICSNDPVYRPSKLVPGYPTALEDVVMQALEKDPDKRFPTANDMLRALDQSLPQALRASTDEEVSTFVRSLLGDRFQKRRDAIKEALRLADDRPTLQPGMMMRGSSPSFPSLLTPLTMQTSADLLPVETSSGGGSGVRTELFSSLPATSSLSAVKIPQAEPDRASGAGAVVPEKPRGHASTWIAAGSGVVAVAAIAALAFVLGKRAPAAAAFDEPRASAPTSAAPSAPEPAASATAPVPSDSAAPAPSADTPEPAPSASHDVREPRTGSTPTGTRTTGTRSTGGSATASATNTNVPQVRNPGF